MATKKKSSASPKAVPVLVGNTRNGLWFGYTTDTSETTVNLKQARQVVYWSEDCKGAAGLAANGPTSGCRITAPIPEAIIRDVCVVGLISPESAAKFEAAPWKS